MYIHRWAGGDKVGETERKVEAKVHSCPPPFPPLFLSPCSLSLPSVLGQTQKMRNSPTRAEEQFKSYEWLWTTQISSATVDLLWMQSRYQVVKA